MDTLDVESPTIILRKLLPVDTKDNLQQARKQLHRLHDKAVLSARLTMSEAVGGYGRFAVAVADESEPQIYRLRECVEQLRQQSADLMADCTLIDTSLHPLSTTPTPTQPTKTTITTAADKITGWLDDLHEYIAVHDDAQAVEAIDRLRFELQQSNTDDAPKRSLSEYTAKLTRHLLCQLSSNCMDVPVVAKCTTHLHHLGAHQEARDCLLAAFSRRIRRLSTACYRSPPLLAAIVGRSLRQSALLFRRCFVEAAAWSGVVVWLEAHVLELISVVQAAVGGDRRRAVEMVKRETEPLQRDCNVDLDFLFIYH